MDEEASGDAIARIEERIEALAEELARCRKISLAAELRRRRRLHLARSRALVGLISLMCTFMTVGAIAAIIGGVVLLGSNATTWTQTENAIRASEALRADMIGRISNCARSTKAGAGCIEIARPCGGGQDC